MNEDSLPCGRCDVGIYSYAAALTPLAHTLAGQSPAERTPPRCKSFDRACVGACDFITAINADPEQWHLIKAEVEGVRNA